MTISILPAQEISGFAKLGLGSPILQALDAAGYQTPTPIQSQAIAPAILGQDLLLSAQTGSGKTAAFVLPILQRLIDAGNKSTKPSNKTKAKVMAVILTPTRELALQVQASVRTYSSRMKGVFSVPLVGGADYRGQIRALTKGVQVIVATPGRFLDHYQAGRIDLSALEMLVLDEADRMLDMGFSEAINEIILAMPQSRQTIMSSATWDGQVGKIAEQFTDNPTKITIAVESAHIDESVYFCDDFRHKNDILHGLLGDEEISQAVIFTATKLSTERLAQDLQDKGYTAHYLHGDLPQGKRNRVVKDIKDKKCRFLIATDVAARGIDIAGISHVINYDLPKMAEDYVHRIGRSGRAGRTGVAISLCSRDDRHLLHAIHRYLNRKMRIETMAGLEPKQPVYESKFGSSKPSSKGRSDKKPITKTPKRPNSKGAQTPSDDASPIWADGFQREVLAKKSRMDVSPSNKSRASKSLSNKHSSKKTATTKTLAKSPNTTAQGKTLPKAEKIPANKARQTNKPHTRSKPRKEALEFVFHQTAKRRFGDK